MNAVEKVGSDVAEITKTKGADELLGRGDARPITYSEVATDQQKKITDFGANAYIVFSTRKVLHTARHRGNKTQEHKSVAQNVFTPFFYKNQVYF